MNQADAFSILQTMFALALELSMPLLVIGMIVGVIISIFQAMTQINDSTLSLVPKILAIFAAIAVLGPWMFQQLIGFTTRMLTYVPGVGS